jgi:hypothetical protein
MTRPVRLPRRCLSAGGSAPEGSSARRARPARPGRAGVARRRARVRWPPLNGRQRTSAARVEQISSLTARIEDATRTRPREIQLHRSKRSLRRSAGTSQARAPDDFVPWLSLCLIHLCPEPFTGDRQSASCAGQGHRRPVLAGGAQSSKACDGATHPWVQIPPPPPKFSGPGGSDLPARLARPNPVPAPARAKPSAAAGPPAGRGAGRPRDTARRAS